MDQVEPGTFRVTITVERPDGKYITSSCAVSDDLHDDYGVMAAALKLGKGFAEAYANCSELPA